MRLFLTIFTLTLAVGLSTITASARDGAVIFAAASLRGVLEEVLEDVTPTPVISYGGSGTLARQVAQGAPADAVLLANPEWLDWLAEQVPVAEQDPQDIISNRLVVIGAADAQPLSPGDARHLATLLGPDGRLAMGQHMSVPAGIYAAAWLNHTEQWGDLTPRLAETENVRVALALVARGDAPLGIVYASDALAEGTVQVLYDIPAGEHPQIRYGFAALTDKGSALRATLMSAEAQTAFEAAGFMPLAQEAQNDG